jgi:hypothetical protein
VTAQPVLTRVPQGELIGADRLSPQWPQAMVLFSDGRWRPATIVAWCRYRHGWAALLHWPDGHEDWRHHDPQCLLRSVEQLGGWGSA